MIKVQRTLLELVKDLNENLNGISNYVDEDLFDSVELDYTPYDWDEEFFVYIPKHNKWRLTATDLYHCFAIVELSVIDMETGEEYWFLRADSSGYLPSLISIDPKNWKEKEFATECWNMISRHPQWEHVINCIKTFQKGLRNA